MDHSSCLIPGLPDDVIHSRVLSGISWWDFAAATCVSKLWRFSLRGSQPLLPSPPQSPQSLPDDILSRMELEGRRGYGLLVLGRKVVIAGGQSQDVIATDRVEMFDVDKKRWESLPSLGTPLSTCVMGIIVASPTRESSKIVALGGVRGGEGTFWIDSAQLLGYGDREWAQVDPGMIPKLLEGFSSVSEPETNLAMLSLESGGLAKALIGSI